MTLKSGPVSKGAITVAAGNDAKRGETAFATGAAPVSATAQVVVRGGACFEADLGTVKKADGAQLKAKAP